MSKTIYRGPITPFITGDGVRIAGGYDFNDRLDRGKGKVEV